MDKLASLTAPIERHIQCWLPGQAESQRRELEALRGRAVAEPREFGKLQAELTASHRDRAKQVYGADTLVWEVPPDDAFATGNWADLNTGESAVFTNLADVRDAMLSHRITVGATTAYPFPGNDAQGNVIWPLQLDFTSLDKSLAFHKDFPQFIQRIRASGRGYDAFCFMMFDETLDEKVGQICQLVHSMDPNVRMMIAIPQADQGSTRGLVAAGMNIFCCHAPRLEYDNAPDGMGVLSSGGRELWFYAAADSAFGVGKETDPLGWNRYLHWAAFRHGASGAHFWNMLWSNGGSPVWPEEPVGSAYFPTVYPAGPGYPPLPEDVRTAETVIPSRRWEYVRMGIEDYMLLTMARDKIANLGAGGDNVPATA